MQRSDILRAFLHLMIKLSQHIEPDLPTSDFIPSTSDDISQSLKRGYILNEIRDFLVISLRF
jgi:hypothetical protein